jgi:hypothetical protein
VPIERLDRPTVQDFLSWVFDRAVAEGGTNPGRTWNKARTHLRAVISWAWENDLLEMPPRFPKPVPYNNVAGKHYLTKKELNSLYFATHEMRRPRGWANSIPVGRYWRAALVVFFNYGLDSGTVWGTTPEVSVSFGSRAKEMKPARVWISSLFTIHRTTANTIRSNVAGAFWNRTGMEPFFRACRSR